MFHVKHHTLTRGCPIGQTGRKGIQLKVLVACEESQRVCKAFRERGHEAYSCDIIDCSLCQRNLLLIT